MSTSEDSQDEAPGATWVGRLNRRAFLRSGALTGAAVALIGSVPGLSGMLAAGSSDAPAVAGDAAGTETELAPLQEPLIAHVTNAATGEISLLHGTDEVVVHDPALAQRLLSAARP